MWSFVVARVINSWALTLTALKVSGVESRSLNPCMLIRHPVGYLEEVRWDDSWVLLPRYRFAIWRTSLSHSLFCLLARAFHLLEYNWLGFFFFFFFFFFFDIPLFRELLMHVQGSDLRLLVAAAAWALATTLKRWWRWRWRWMRRTYQWLKVVPTYIPWCAQGGRNAIQLTNSCTTGI